VFAVKLAGMTPDVLTIDSLIRTLYECVTCSPGAAPQFERDRALFVKDPLICADRAEGMRRMTLDEWMAGAEPILASGFYEAEIARQEMRFGRIAHVTSVYEARLSKDAPLLKRGINSLQLLREGGRWWILSIVWDNERSDNPIPASLLEHGLRT
jgi:hypothetical protein